MGKIKSIVRKLTNLSNRKKKVFVDLSSENESYPSTLKGILTHSHLLQAVMPIFVPTLAGFKSVRVDKIICCQADSSYTIFHMEDLSKLIASRRLREFEQTLVQHRFFRVHKSHLINLAHIDEFIREGGIVVMNNKMRIPVSRDKKAEFLNTLIYRS